MKMRLQLLCGVCGQLHGQQFPWKQYVSGIHALLLGQGYPCVSNAQELCRMRTQTMLICPCFLTLMVQACRGLVVLNKLPTGAFLISCSASVDYNRDLSLKMCRDGVFSLKGPTLLQGKRKKNVEAIRAHSAGFLPCMLGMQEDATARNNSSHL